MRIILILTLLLFGGLTPASPVLPVPKQCAILPGALKLETVRVNGDSDLLGREIEELRAILQRRGINEGDGGFGITLQLGEFSFPARESVYRPEIERQAHRITANENGIEITGRSPQAVYHALQTFDQLLDGKLFPPCEITDWPDISVRMIMIDPARQNESFAYYREIIRFAARHKINAVLCHLTDDQTSALRHDDYPELMHPHAWTEEEVIELRDFARAHYIELIPEIESLGHSRMFTRRSDYAKFLHQRKEIGPHNSWMGTDLADYTNVLCPASEEAGNYLDSMYRAAAAFDHPWLHIGFDEVDITHCDRCIDAFGELTPSQWILKAFDRCKGPAEKQNRKVALWGDMLLSHRDVVDDLSTSGTIIFDWHYTENVQDESALFFKAKGFEVIASPALVCAPHMIMPDEHNFENIRRFTAIARENDLLGINTTIWIPTRYLSDVLWTGIAFSAAHAWAGGNLDERELFVAFARDHFGSGKGAEYHSAWARQGEIIWHANEFNAACWRDEESFVHAGKMAAEKGDEIRAKIAELDSILQELSLIAPSVRRHEDHWRAIEQSIAIMQYTMRHLAEASNARTEAGWNIELIGELDRGCTQAIEWIEADWIRNRYADDPNMDGLYLPHHHLLFRFRQMHQYHQALLSSDNSEEL